MIFSVESVVYNGKVHNHLEKLDKVVQSLKKWLQRFITLIIFINI